jgi:UDP-N-acetylmuramate dehydrogenase
MDLSLVNAYCVNAKGKKEQITALAHRLGERASQDEPLAAHTSLRIGGPADLYVVAHNTEELVQYLALARAYEMPWFLLGGGTNILVSDRGIRGLVIANHSRDYDTQFLSTGQGNGGVRCLLHAASGVPLAKLAQYTTRLGLSGLQWAVGLPGTVGGAVVNNAGAFGADMADTLQQVRLLTPAGRTVTWSPEELDFDYRTSRLKKADHGHVVLEAIFSLERAAASKVQEQAAAYRDRRKASQPKGASAGSAFKNPPGDYAGRLIECAGFKGATVGGARVSEKHANFIINTGEATADDVMALIRRIQETVYAQFAVRLELEIECVGDWQKRS